MGNTNGNAKKNWEGRIKNNKLSNNRNNGYSYMLKQWKIPDK